MNLQQYWQELLKVRVLSPAIEQNLWHEFKDGGNTAARARLIESYQPLVFREASPFRAQENLPDIIQEGTVGLIEAVENYDYKLGVAFSLYAMHRIRGRMLNFVAKENKVDVACLDADFVDGLSRKDNLPDHHPAVAEQAERSEIIGRVISALRRLPGRERAVLESVYLHSEAVPALADEMNLSASYIYRLQKSGLRRLRGMLSRFMKQRQ